MVVEYNLQTKGDEKCPPAKTPFYVAGPNSNGGLHLLAPCGRILLLIFRQPFSGAYKNSFSGQHTLP